MHRLVGLIGLLAISMVAAGCGLGLPATVDPPCRGHHDPGDCQAALDVGLGDLIFDPDTHTLSVAPISCNDDTCTTWVSALPTAVDDCLPSYEVEMTRDLDGPWTVAMSAHGDPPCAFEP